MSQPVAISLHEQVRNTLLFEIESGAFARGGRLPPEPELCERFGVSRITVRRAVADLEAMGLVTRQQGRGTFVSAPRSTLGTMTMGGFSDQFSVTGAAARRIVRAQTTASDADLATKLGVSVGSPVFRLVRVFSIDRVPLSMDDSSYPLERYPGFDAMVDESTSTYRMLREQFGVHFHAVDRRIGVGYVTGETALLLDRPEHDAIVTIDKEARDREDAVIHISTVQVVPSRLELRVTAHEE